MRRVDIMGADEAAGEVLNVPKPLPAAALARARQPSAMMRSSPMVSRSALRPRAPRGPILPDRSGPVAFSMPLGFSGPALQAPELGDPRAQLSDRLLERRVLRQQTFHPGLEVAARQH
jgi:hypothetical protein